MIKLAIIGSNFGKIGLLPAFNSIKKCMVVELYNGKDWQKCLKRNDLDAVALAVPPNIQYQIAKVAIKKGLNIFAEKPLTANLKQARELASLAKKNKIITAVDFLFSEIPEWKKVKEFIKHETFGKLKHISVNWDWLSGDIKYKRKSWKTSIREGGGILSFYFSHGFYYLENFTGKIEGIKTKLTYSKESLNGAEVGVDMQIKWKNEVTGNVHVACNNKNLVRHQLIFECENGKIILEAKNSIVDNFIITTHSKNKTEIIEAKRRKEGKKEDERVKIVRILAKRFIDSCISKKQMTPSFKEGLRVQELIELARKGKI